MQNIPIYLSSIDAAISEELVNRQPKRQTEMHTIALEEGLSYIITPHLPHATLFTQEFEL